MSNLPLPTEEADPKPATLPMQQIPRPDHTSDEADEWESGDLPPTDTRTYMLV